MCTRMQVVKDIVAIDSEYFQHTGKLHRPGGKLACLTLSSNGKKADLIEDPTQVKEALLQLKKSGTTIAMQNAHYDLQQLRTSGLWPNQWEPKIHDTMLVNQALFGGLFQLNSLADLSRRWLGTYLPKDTVLDFISAEKMTPEMKRYSKKDAVVTQNVAYAQQKYVEDKFGGDFGWYWDIDLPAMWAVLEMQPIRVDVDGWLLHGQELYAEGVAIQDSLGFNVKSTNQVKKALRSVGIKPYKTVDDPTMEKWLEKATRKGNQKQVNLITAIRRARKCRDAMSKYGDKWVEKNVEGGEWVYPSWNVTGAETGRMSCSKPNMQNIPKRGEGSIFRSFFLATKGGRLLVGDVQQQEPRFSAFLSRDPNLTEEIMNGTDLHQRAADLFNLTGSNARDRGKAINLGLNYGMSAWGLSGRVGISQDAAEAGIQARRRHYNRYYAWQDRQVRAADRRGYVTTVSGRPLWTNEYNFGYKRNAINSPIQGSAADQIKLALGYVREQCKAASIPFCVNLVVHDEIVMDVPAGMMKTYRYILDQAWKEAGHKLMPTIPTVVDLKSGKNWRVHS